MECLHAHGTRTLRYRCRHAISLCRLATLISFLTDTALTPHTSLRLCAIERASRCTCALLHAPAIC